MSSHNLLPRTAEIILVWFSQCALYAGIHSSAWCQKPFLYNSNPVLFFHRIGIIEWYGLEGDSGDDLVQPCSA